MAKTDCMVGDEGDLATEVSHLICCHENIRDTLRKAKRLGAQSMQAGCPPSGGPGHPPEQAVSGKGGLHSDVQFTCFEHFSPLCSTLYSPGFPQTVIQGPLLFIYSAISIIRHFAHNHSLNPRQPYKILLCIQT